MIIQQYGSSVSVTGHVQNNTDDSNLDEIAALDWSASEFTAGENIVFDSDTGNYGFTVDIPVDQSGMVTITVTGTDINGNKSYQYLHLQDDSQGPQINLTAPENYSQFGMEDNLLEVSGTIRNSEGEANSGSTVNAVWILIGSGVSQTGPVTILSDDTFSFTLDTSGITESSFIIRITASGSDSHTSSSDLVLYNDNKSSCAESL